MGCDIHGMIEVKIDGEWTGYSRISLARDYRLFSLLAGVRSSGDRPEPIAPDRGFPDDAAKITRLMRDDDGSDGHSDTFLTLDEMDKSEVLYEEILRGDGKRFCYPPEPWGYLFGNGWHKTSLIDGVEDARVIIWFDN